jgi:hypothetical protein
MTMARAWFSYIVLAMGLMMLLGSDRPSVAGDKETVEADTVVFDTKKDIQIFINKQGNDSEVIDLMVNGKKINFTLPELKDGETKTFTTADGTEIIVKSLTDSRVVWVDGEEINLPSLHEGGLMGKEGLSSIITRVHGLSDFQKNTVTLSGHGLSEDARRAMVDAVQGVLTSYGIDKEVVFREQNQVHVISEDIKGFDGNLKFIEGGDFEIKVDKDLNGDKKIMVIENKVITKKKEDK